MRGLIGLGLLVFTFGCGSDGAATNPIMDAGATGLDAHLAGPGSCTTACDCQPGLACLNGNCASGPQQTYCCEAATCPSGAGCQTMSGSYSTCVSATTATTGSNGSSGGTSAGTGSSGGIIGGLTGTSGGLPSFGDGGLGGIIGGSSGGIPGLGDGGAGGIIGGLSGSSGGTTSGGDCGFIPSSADSDCTGLGCTSCGPSGMCQ
jgi:hypothetical protein